MLAGAGLAEGGAGNVGQSHPKELPDWTSYPPPRGSHTTSAWPPASGGTLFGKVAFNPNLSLIGSKTERGKVGGTTCNRFNALNAASFVLAAATWLPQRFGLTGERRHLRVVRNLVLAKDVLMGVAGSVGLSVLVLQIVLYRQAPKGAVPLERGGVPAAEASDRASWLQRAVSVLGSVHIALFASIVALTTMLCLTEACQSANQSLLSAGTLIRAPEYGRGSSELRTFFLPLFTKPRKRRTLGPSGVGF